MIHIFRKEMKKWHTVLWVVFASLAFSGVAMIFRGGTSIDEMKVATVNGRGVFMKSYRGALAQVQERLAGVREYARMLGISEEMLMASFFGASDPYQIALDNCIKETLLDEVKKPFDIHVTQDYFNEEFVKTLPRGFVDEQGRINMDSYQMYIKRLGLTPSDYEQLREDEFKRQLIDKFIAAAFYTPDYVAQAQYAHDHGKKRFAVMAFPLHDMIKEVKTETPSDEELKAFYQRHRDRWIVPEKRKALTWEISAENYGKTISIDPQAVERFYEQNKSSKYRIPPKVQVRHILISKGDDAEKALKEAQGIYEQIKENPVAFEKLARQHSDDEKTANKGGLTELFMRGTYDPDFETAAFRLQNKGDLSDIVKTAQGFEIIKLHDRINADTKPLEDVKDEIIKTLRAKRSVNDLKSKIEIMMRSGNGEQADFEAFAKKIGFKASESEWLTQDDAHAKDAKGELAQRLFSGQSKASQKGYFFEEGLFTLYFRTATEKSFVPKLDTIKDDVLEFYFESEAKTKMTDVLKEVRTSFLNQKVTLSDIAEKFNNKLIETEWLSKKDKIHHFGKAEHLVGKLFGLTDKSQLLSYKDDQVYYVGTLLEAEPLDEKAFQEKKDAIIERDKQQGAQALVRSFIASLQRNAKIDVDKSIVKNYVGR